MQSEHTKKKHWITLLNEHVSKLININLCVAPRVCFTALSLQRARERTNAHYSPTCYHKTMAKLTKMQLCILLCIYCLVAILSHSLPVHWIVNLTPKHDQRNPSGVWCKALFVLCFFIFVFFCIEMIALHKLMEQNETYIWYGNISRGNSIF